MDNQNVGDGLNQASVRDARVFDDRRDRRDSNVPTLKIGAIVIVIGYLVHASGSNEDPAIVNSVSPDGTSVNVTMFPEGVAPRNARNVRLFGSRDEALAARPSDPIKSTNPDLHLVAYPFDSPDSADAVKYPGNPLPLDPVLGDGLLSGQPLSGQVGSLSGQNVAGTRRIPA